MLLEHKGNLKNQLHFTPEILVHNHNDFIQLVNEYLENTDKTWTMMLLNQQNIQEERRTILVQNSSATAY